MRTATLLFCCLFATACGGAADPGQDPGPDAGSNPDGGSDPNTDASPDAPVAGGQLVFITSNFYDGDLKTAGAGTDGLDGADKLCQLHADSASLPGTFRAWLSTANVDAIDHITGPGPWKNTMGEVVFANRAQLQTHPLLAVGYDEHGDGLYPLVWTGTDVGREAPKLFSSDSTSTCADWTSKSAVTPSSVYGDSGQGTSGAWSRNGYDGCYETHALYCFSVL
jgi:hypothetical protein